MESKQEFYAWIDYVNEVEISIKEILNDYGVSKEIRNDKNILNTYLLDMAYEKFIPKEKVFTAATLGYEMNIEPSTVGIYISFFIAFHELERQPKGLLSFFKKEKSDFNFKKIIQATQEYVIDTKDLFEEYFAKLDNKIAKK